MSYLGADAVISSLIFRCRQIEMADKKDNAGRDPFMGLAQMSWGSVTVNNRNVTDNTRFLLTVQDGSTNIGFAYISSRVAGRSFTISSNNGLSFQSVLWILIEPLP